MRAKNASSSVMTGFILQSAREIRAVVKSGALSQSAGVIGPSGQSPSIILRSRKRAASMYSNAVPWINSFTHRPGPTFTLIHLTFAVRRLPVWRLLPGPRTTTTSSSIGGFGTRLCAIWMIGPSLPPHRTGTTCLVSKIATNLDPCASFLMSDCDLCFNNFIRCYPDVHVATSVNSLA